MFLMILAFVAVLIVRIHSKNDPDISTPDTQTLKATTPSYLHTLRETMKNQFDPGMTHSVLTGHLNQYGT